MIRRLELAVALAASLASATASASTDRASERQRMIASIEKAASDVPALRDDPVFVAAVAAESRLPRETFVPRAAVPYAYLGAPLEIGWKQTISDPYIMAVMSAAVGVRSGSRVLEVGTGSGYQAAVLAELGADVSTIEIVPELARRAARVLRRRGYRNVTVRTGDGFAGWPERSPFDAVMVTAGAARVPQPLLDQLRVGGRLVMPIGPSTPTEHLMVYTKRQDGGFDVCSLGWAMFVPLTGRGYTGERPGLSERGARLCYGAPVT